MKTMAIRVEDEFHAQYVVLAQLDGIPLADELRQALDAHLERKRSEPGFAEKAQATLDELDREARTKRDAIAGLFAKERRTEAEPSEGEARPGNGGRRGRQR